MLFDIIIKNKDESSQWAIPYQSFSFTEELNNDRNASFSFSYQHAEKVASVTGETVLDVFFAAFRIIEVYNQDTSELLYKGYLRALRRTRNTSDKGSITVDSKGLFQLLDKRLTNADVFYSSEDLSDIAWDIIDTTQSKTYGDLGITRGANPVTRDAQRTYNYDIIGESIDKLSNKERKDGFDYDVDMTDKFNVYYPFRGDDNGVTFTDGVNIMTYSIQRKSVDELVNSAVVQSTQSYGEGSLIATSAGTPANQSAFGLLEEYMSDDAKLLSTVQDKANRIIELNEYPYNRISLTVNLNRGGMEYNMINVGDFVTVVIAEEQIDGLFRVYSKGLNNEGIMSLEVREDNNT